MELYLAKNEASGAGTVVLDDMILTKDLPTTAGSKMLDGYVSLFEATILQQLRDAGCAIGGKVNTGEFGVDLLGETSYKGACVKEDGTLAYASAELIKAGGVSAAIHMDVHGAPRRAAALENLVFLKPTYGTVSRFGTIPTACSGETVGVLAATAQTCAELFSAIAHHDDKDGTSLAEADCRKAVTPGAGVKTVAMAASLCASADEATRARIEAARDALTAAGIEVTEVNDSILLAAKTAWNILLSAETCNNVSRYDGVKFGYRSATYEDIDELYTNSRTEAFGKLLKTVILYGSDALATANYDAVYDKALRIRRVVCERFAALFAQYDAVLLPACSKTAFRDEALTASFDEAAYTAPASITGLPAVVAGGVQLIGRALSDADLLKAAAVLSKEGV